MKKRVLLVEDDKSNIDVMSVELEVLGYEVKVAKNGQEAIDMALSELPDIILMDIHLPKMDGLKAASELRQHSKTRAIPILAQTAKALPEEKARCIAAGCDGYIAKPFTYKELGAALEKLLAKSKTGR